MDIKYIYLMVLILIASLVGGYFLITNKPSSLLVASPSPSSQSLTIQTSMPSASITPIASPKASVITMDNGLKIEDIKVGTGEEAVGGKKVTVNYSGTLTDGTKFDSSYDRNQPFSFNLGAGEVIEGWDLGVAGMKVGGKRKLTIPSDLGYGSAGAGGVIPPNATLIFEVDLLGVE